MSIICFDTLISFLILDLKVKLPWGGWVRVCSEFAHAVTKADLCPYPRTGAEKIAEVACKHLGLNHWGQSHLTPHIYPLSKSLQGTGDVAILPCTLIGKAKLEVEMPRKRKRSSQIKGQPPKRPPILFSKPRYGEGK